MKKLLGIRSLVGVCAAVFCVSSAWGTDVYFKCSGTDDNTRGLTINMRYLKNKHKPMGISGPISLTLTASKGDLFWSPMISAYEETTLTGWTPEPQLVHGEVVYGDGNTGTLGRWKMSTNAQNLDVATDWELRSNNSRGKVVEVFATRISSSGAGLVSELQNVDISGNYQCHPVQIPKEGCVCAVS